MFEHKNLYPVILVPGVVAYGEGVKLHKVFPYFGMTSTSYEKVIRDMGMNCNTASFELLSGVWDRACELYAQIVGGTVDYGAVHSEKYGHARFGKTYEKPMVEGWDKITLIAHGFGAPVARLFIYLLENGSEEERTATPTGELSDLFKGGFYNKIHSLVTLAGVNDGVSIAEAFEGRLPGSKKLFAKGATIFDTVLSFTEKTNDNYYKNNDAVSQHGFNTFLGKENDKLALKFNDEAIDKYLNGEDNLFYDMGPLGMAKLNAKLSTSQDVYYFSFSGEVTKNILGKVTLPGLKAGITLPTAALIGTYENYLPEAPVITSKDHDNDGIVNTNSSLAPVNESATAFKDVSRCQPGIWYQMPVENKNHFAYTGLFVRPDKYMNEIYDLMKIICNLD